LTALESVDGIGLGLIEHVSGLGRLEPVQRGDADIGHREARAVLGHHLLGYHVQLALVRAASLAVLAHVVALDRAHDDHRLLGAAAGVRNELVPVELLVAEPDDDRVAPVVLAQQRPGEASTVQLGQRGQEIALAVVGGQRGHVAVRGIDRYRRQLPLVADHHDVAGTRHRQSCQQEVDLRSLIDDEVVEQVPVSDAVPQRMTGTQQRRVILDEVVEYIALSVGVRAVAGTVRFLVPSGNLGMQELNR